MGRREEKLHSLQKVNEVRGQQYLTVPLREPVSVADLEVPENVRPFSRKRAVPELAVLQMPYRIAPALTEPLRMSAEQLRQLSEFEPGELQPTVEWTTQSMKRIKAPTDLVFRFMNLTDGDLPAVTKFVSRFGPVSTAPIRYVDRDSQAVAIVWWVADLSEFWKLAAEMNAVALISADLRERGASTAKDWKALADGRRAFGTLVNPPTAWGEDPKRDIALARLPAVEQWNELTTWVNGWLQATDLKPSVGYDHVDNVMTLHYEGRSTPDYEAEITKYGNHRGKVIELPGPPPTSTFRALVFQLLAALSRAHVYRCSRCNMPFSNPERKLRPDRSQYCSSCRIAAKNERNQVWYRKHRKQGASST